MNILYFWREKNILEINSPKQNSLKSAKEHLRVESFLLSSELTEKQKHFVIWGSKYITTEITIISNFKMIFNYTEMF